MLEDAQKEIWESLMKSGKISRLSFLKSGKISVKFTAESKSFRVKKLSEVLELLETY